MRTYTIRAEWADGSWVLSVPELPGLSRQVRWLAEAGGAIRGDIASELGVEPESVGVEVVPVMRSELAELVDQVARARDELARVQSQVNAATRQAIDVLTGAGFQVEDAARILGMKVGHGVGDVGGALGVA